MQKLVVFGLIFLILLIGFYYYRNYSSKKMSKVDNTDRSDFLTGLTSDGAGTTFVGGKDGEESIKMRDSYLLKNTVMSLKPLLKLPSSTSQNLYPDYIREGLFYLKLSGTPDNNAWCLGGNIHKDNDIIKDSGLQIASTDLNVDRNAFAQNSFTTFANNDNIKNKFSALPILLNFASKNNDEFSFYMKDIRKGIGQQVNIWSGDNQTYIINDETFCIIDLKHGRMPWYNSSTGRFSSSQAWYKWNIDGISPRRCSGDGEYRSRFRTYKLFVTGDNNNTFYIQETQSGQYFCNKGTGLLEASNSNDGSDKMKWVLEYTTQNDCDGYIIRSKLDNRWLRWIGDWDKWELNNGSGPDWAWAIIRPQDLGWDVYDFFRSISKADGFDRGRADWSGPDIVSAINYYGWNKTASSITGDQFENTNDSRHGCYQNYWGNWIVHNGKKLLQVPYGVPGMRIGDRNHNDDASLYTFVQNKGGWSIKNKYRNKYLTFSLNKGTIVPIFNTTDLNKALTFELVPVLTKEMALRYLQASVASLKGIGTRELRQDALKDFCGNNILFKDGTLKMEIGSVDKVANDEVTRAFERICACNMNSQYDSSFYIKSSCSDQWIKDNYGLENDSEGKRYLAIRGTLKCNTPECGFQKCRNLTDENKNQNGSSFTLFGNPNADPVGECGSKTMCIVNQTINNSGNIVGGQLNMSAKQQCGVVGNDSVKTETGSDYEWINISGSQSVINNQGNISGSQQGNASGGNVNIQPSSQTPKEITVYSEPNLSGNVKNLTLGTYTSENIGFEVKSMKVPLGLAVEFKKNNTTNGIKFSNVYKSSFGNNIQEYEDINFPDLSQKNIIVVSTADIYTPPNPTPVDPNETPEQYRARREREQQEREQKEREQKEKEQKTISDAITSVPQGISKITGFSGNFDDFSSEKNQTAEMCRQKAINSNGKYVAWGHRNENHPDPNYRNTCFLYKSPPFLKPNPPFTFTNDQVHSTGCLKEGDAAIYGCKSREEIGNKLKDLEVELFEQPNYVTSLGKYKFGMLPPQAYGNKVIRSIKVPVGKKVNLVTNESANPETQNLIKGNVPSININNIKFILIKDEPYDLF